MLPQTITQSLILMFKMKMNVTNHLHLQLHLHHHLDLFLFVGRADDLLFVDDLRRDFLRVVECPLGHLRKKANMGGGGAVLRDWRSGAL